MDGADHALFELKDVSAAQETALGTEVATNLHLTAGSELVADQVYNVSVKLSPSTGELLTNGNNGRHQDRRWSLCI